MKQKLNMGGDQSRNCSTANHDDMNDLRYVVGFTHAASGKPCISIHADWRAAVAQIAHEAAPQEPAEVSLAEIDSAVDAAQGGQMFSILETITLSGANSAHPADRSLMSTRELDPDIAGELVSDILNGFRALIDMEADEDC